MEKDGSIRAATNEEIAQKLTREKHWDLERIARGKALENPVYRETFQKQVEFNKKHGIVPKRILVMAGIKPKINQMMSGTKPNINPMTYGMMQNANPVKHGIV